MAPLLIDGRDLLKLGFITSFVVLLVFSAGFLTGHQRAAIFYQAGSDVQPLILPEAAVFDSAFIDSQRPEIVEAGENIDVDLPEKEVLIENSTKLTLKKNSLPVEKNVNSKNNKTNLASDAKTSGVNNASPAAAVVPVRQTVNITELSPDALNKIKYSVQVGMYGRLVNAENMMKLLQAQQYDAYVTDYVNAKNEIRYNVRFGYFSNKKSALSKLDEFKSSHKSDGYLVSFSADNIVKTVNAANAEDIEPASDASINDDKAGGKSAPEVMPSFLMQNKLSQTKVLKSADVLANTSSEIN